MKKLSFTKWIYTFVFILLLSLLPTQLGKHFFFDFSYLSGVRIDYLAPTIYLTDIISIFFIALNSKHLFSLIKVKKFWVFISLLIINCIFSLIKQISVYESFKLLEVFFLFWIVLKEKIFTTFYFNKLILFAFLVGGIFESILGILQVFYKHSIQGVFYFFGERYFSLSTPDIAKASLRGVEILRAYGTFSHPNSLAGFYLLLYFFVLLFPGFKKYTLLKYATLLFCSILVLISFSKIPILLFFFLNMWFIIRNPDASSSIFSGIAKLAVLMIISGLFIFTKGDQYTLIKREDLFQDAVTIVGKYPWFGTGLGNYLVAQNQFPIKYSYFFLQPVHNIFLLFLSETGVFFTGFIGYIALTYLKSHLKNQALLYMLFVVVFTGMFDHYWLTIQQNMLILLILLGLTLNKGTAEI